MIMGSQLACQALASFAISVELIPTVYRRAELPGETVCHGVDCFLDSFLSLAALNVVGFVCSIILWRRNIDSLPVNRLPS